ncbi:unnamed protein product, partial [Heterosigma akashiwo]
ELDDLSSAWLESQAGDRKWGGRARGGRGVQKYCIDAVVDDVVLEKVTLSYEGENLLEETRLQIIHGKIYGLIGSNGCGKSTLLDRISGGLVPGWPSSMRVHLVPQDIEVTDDAASARDVVAMAAAQEQSAGSLGSNLQDLLEERARLESSISQSSEVISRLCEIEELLAILGVDDTDHHLEMQRKTATDILLSLNFSDEQIDLPLSALSGGFRMRVALACAVARQPDILLLDEPTNHLDLETISWLENFLRLARPQAAVVVVSHDEAFLEAIATDIILFHGRRLQYFACRYTEYQALISEREARTVKLVEARARQEREAADLVARAHATTAGGGAAGGGRRRRGAGKSDGPALSKQKAARQKLEKAERQAFYREDGRRYKLHSLKTLSEEAVRLPSTATADDLRRDPTLRFKFLSCDPAGLRLASPTAPVLSLDGVDFRYGQEQGAPASGGFVLRGVTVQVSLGSRVAIVGANGAGKSTLARLLAGQLEPLATAALAAAAGGGRRRAPGPPGLRVALVAQHHVEALAAHLALSPCQLLQLLPGGPATEAAARQLLGGFGLPGAAALAPVALLSGGQRARLALALACRARPHVLVLDEPTNHLDLDSRRALAVGLAAFDGAVLLAGHDRAFLAGVCGEVWAVRGGRVAA